MEQTQSLNNYTHIGKVIDAHGIKGDIYCMIFSDDLSWLTKIKELNFKKPGSKNMTDVIFKSYQIKKTKLFKKGFIATIENMTDRNQAEMLKGAELWLPKNLFVSNDGESLYLSEIKNFLVEDQVYGELGEITDFSTNGAQDLLILKKENEIIEIPFVKEFVVKIDFDLKRVFTFLPEGLLDINKKDEN